MAGKPVAAIPEPPKSSDPALRQFLTAIKEAVEVRLGRRGDPLDEAITKRELIDSGLAKLRSAYNSNLSPVVVAPEEARIVPPVPIGFVAEGVFGGIHLTWENPSQAYNVHALAEVWRGESNDPTKRVLLNSSRGTTFFDRIPDKEAKEYWYWVRFVSEYNREGPFSLPFKAAKQADVAELVAEISGQIDESVLSQSLNRRIDLTESGLVAEALARAQGIAAEALARGAAIISEQQARVTADGALASDLSALSVSLGGTSAAVIAEQQARITGDEALASDLNALTVSVDAAAAAIISEQQARVTADGALASDLQGLSTTVGANTASIAAQSTSINGLSAQYTLRLNTNGYVSGFGAYNDGRVSEFTVVADRFSIAPPGSTGKIKPFIVQDNTVYIDTAMIRNASIQQGKLGPISFGKITDAAGNPVTTLAGKLRADAIDVTNLQVTDANIAGVLRSNQVAANGQPRWMLDKNGGMALNGSGTRGRMEIRDNVIKVFDSTGRLRVQLGDLLA